MNKLMYEVCVNYLLFSIGLLFYSSAYAGSFDVLLSPLKLFLGFPFIEVQEKQVGELGHFFNASFERNNDVYDGVVFRRQSAGFGWLFSQETLLDYSLVVGSGPKLHSWQVRRSVPRDYVSNVRYMADERLEEWTESWSAISAHGFVGLEKSFFGNCLIQLQYVVAKPGFWIGAEPDKVDNAALFASQQYLTVKAGLALK